MGHITAIHIAPSASAPMQALEQVEAIASQGLAGDRYANETGFYSPRATDPGAREVTLIETEALEQLEPEHGIQLSPAESRRNLTTRDVRLDQLIGQRFRIGDVVLEGIKDCPPCEHLEQLVGKALLKPLLNRGGLRARIVDGGLLRVGDPVVVLARAAR